MSWFKNLKGKLPPYIKPPSKLNSLDDLLERKGDLAELVELAQDAARYPGVATGKALGKKLKELGLL